VGSSKIFILLVLCQCLQLQVYTQTGLFQDIETNLSEGTVADYLDHVELKTDIQFIYSSAIYPDSVVTISPGNYLVKNLLDSLFIERSIMYVERDGLIILSPQTQHNIANERIIISGVISGRKGEKVSFATIYLKNKSLGTISNADGLFRFVLPAHSLADTLVISCLGYKDVFIAPDKFLTENLEIRLETSNIALKDVIVRPEQPELLVEEAYSLRGENYTSNSTLMSAFFRESSKQDDDYISLTEALVEIKKLSYANPSNDLVRVVKGRNGSNIEESELVNLVVEGGLYNGIRLDVVKYGSYFFAEDAVEECDYTMHKNIFFRDRQTYVIGFQPKDGVTYPAYKGILYIDAETLALVRAEFELSPEGIRKARSLLVKKTPRGYKVRPQHARYEVEYRYYNNIWNLHYARSDFKIKVKKVRGKHNKGFSCDFNSTSEFVVTGISDNKNIRIPLREVSKANDVLFEQVQNTSSTFWLDDNVILPEEPLLSTIKKLQLDQNEDNKPVLSIE
jgi:hypothetical protein